MCCWQYFFHLIKYGLTPWSFTSMDVLLYMYELGVLGDLDWEAVVRGVTQKYRDLKLSYLCNKTLKQKMSGLIERQCFHQYGSECLASTDAAKQLSQEQFHSWVLSIVRLLNHIIQIYKYWQAWQVECIVQEKLSGWGRSVKRFEYLKECCKWEQYET